MYGIKYLLLEWTEGVYDLDGTSPQKRQKHFHSSDAAMDKLNAQISAMHKHNVQARSNFYDDVKVTTFYKNKNTESPWPQKINIHPSVFDKTCWVA